MFSIIYIPLSYAFPNIFKLPRTLMGIPIMIILSVLFLKTYLENNPPDKQKPQSPEGSTLDVSQGVCAHCGKPISYGKSWSEKENRIYHWECWRERQEAKT